MIARLFTSALLVAGLSQAALAQTNTQQNQDLTSAENTQAPSVPQLIRERLTSAGFTDVNVVPGSVVITARDRGGRPVLMRITPNSMFFLTEIASVNSSMTGAGAQDSNEATQQDQASTSAENAQSSARNVPQSATTGVAREGSSATAQQNQASNSAENTQAPSQQAPSQQAAAENVPQSLRDRLASAGFTDVRIAPTSLVISARDQNDRPVMMHITPRSITLLTEVPAVSSSKGADTSGDTGQRK